MAGQKDLEIEKNKGNLIVEIALIICSNPESDRIYIYVYILTKVHSAAIEEGSWAVGSVRL